jgi:hypothetical protein
VKILDLGALRVAFSVLFIPVLIFCSENPGKSRIFPEELKISQKQSFAHLKVFSIFETQGGGAF